MIEATRLTSRDARHQRSYDDLQRLYARYAPRYDRQFARYNDRTLAAALDAIVRPPQRVVDVACGTGLLAERIRHRWPLAALIGIDLSAAMLEQARRRLPPTDGDEHRGPLVWRLGNAEHLPVESGWADTLICTNAFHLVQDPTAALSEFRRVLGEDGTLVIVDWCADHLSMRLVVPALGLLRPQRRKVWPLERLTQALRAAGFGIVRQERFKVGPSWGLMTVVGATEGPKGRGPRAGQGRSPHDVVGSGGVAR
ncbi:MAG: methyltransferase domain-containing protein [Phycisphaerales bacterium]|nr:methyltransferase domain-containing protein [Phycisphaerales bacterium]